MNPIITDALTTAGELTRTVAANLQRTNYTFNDSTGPDNRAAMFGLAEALVCDATGATSLNDRSIIYGVNIIPAFRDAARARMDRRTALTDALTALSREDRIALIDALADGRTVIAA